MNRKIQLILLSGLAILCISCSPSKKGDFPWMIEIDQLTDKDQVDEYWDHIKTIDQSKRGKQSSDSLDNDNFKKVVYMIDKYGYPDQNPTPNIVFTHQSSCHVKEYYFPIFHKGFLEGKADTFWFLHTVRGMHRCRYARDFQKVTVENYEETLKRLSSKVRSNAVSYDLNQFDPLFTKHETYIDNLIEGELLFKWVNSDDDILNLYKSNNKVYLHKVWRDNSYDFPQQVRLEQDSVLNIYFSDTWGKYHYRTDRSNNLHKYAGKQLVDTYYNLTVNK